MIYHPSPLPVYWYNFGVGAHHGNGTGLKKGIAAKFNHLICNYRPGPVRFPARYAPCISYIISYRRDQIRSRRHRPDEVVGAEAAAAGN